MEWNLEQISDVLNAQIEIFTAHEIQ